jgi:hypothetical protein
MRARLLDAAKTLARRWPTVAAVVHRELDAVVQALRDPRLDKLARLIDDGRLAEARALLAALSEDLEPGHPDLVGAVWEFNMAEQAARKAAPVAVEAPASPSGGAGASWDDNPPDDCEAPESHPECPCVRPEEEPSPRPTFADGQRWRAGIGKYTTGRGVVPGTIEVFDECGMVSDVFQNGAEAPRGWYMFEEAPAKPSCVLPGQAWRCVGVEGELEVRWLIGDGASVRLGPSWDDDLNNIVASTADMLGLKEWSFVRGPR